MRSPKRRRASTTRRDLPMPDSPVIETIAPLPSAIASQASSSTASSALRPTSGTIARTCARPRAPVTRATRRGRSIPRSSTSPSDSSSTHSWIWRSVSGPTTMPPSGGELLQARGDVGRVAERVVAVVALVAVREHDRPGVERDAHREVHAVAAAQLLAVGGDRLLDRECCAHRALGVVLVPDRRAEHGEQAVSEQLRDGAVEAAHLGRDQRDDLVEQELGALRADALADRGRADDVGEEDRDDALGARARYHRHEL